MGYVTNFNEWANNIYEKFTEVYLKPNSKFRVFGDRNITIIINTKTNKVGVAKRNPNETFDKIIGIGVAYARYLNMEIPKETKSVSIGSLTENTPFKFKITDANFDINYVIGKLPTNKNYICYCRGNITATAHKDTLVYVVK